MAKLNIYEYKRKAKGSKSEASQQDNKKQYHVIHVGTKHQQYHTIQYPHKRTNPQCQYQHGRKLSCEQCHMEGITVNEYCSSISL